ncbi:hypothetical protein [Vibrio parahaemolyticus]|uniref:hypothetical protein n=1 Tax=Vibrio parahaemolyticus TaxID=670 RepID=UPI002269C856|nr:hypothetical protein [Vibrio parahaemolyticus]MCX8796683.1 hypothetical protein [Vibrio parahaemolyticus]
MSETLEFTKNCEANLREVVLNNEQIKIETDGEHIHWVIKNQSEYIESPILTRVIQELVLLHEENKKLIKRPQYDLGSVSGREQLVIDHLRVSGIDI